MARSNGNGDTEIVSEEAPPPEVISPVSDGNDEFPVPFSRWATTLHRTADEVWVIHMRHRHGRENHKPSEWAVMLDSYRDQPAHPEHPDYKG